MRWIIIARTQCRSKSSKMNTCKKWTSEWRKRWCDINMYAKKILIVYTRAVTIHSYIWWIKNLEWNHICIRVTRIRCEDCGMSVKMGERSTVCRVPMQNVLREEIKEKMVWNIDRSSPSSKIRDLMKWSKDILKDIYYQRKILANPLACFFTKNWWAPPSPRHAPPRCPSHPPGGASQTVRRSSRTPAVIARAALVYLKKYSSIILSLRHTGLLLFIFHQISPH